MFLNTFPFFTCRIKWQTSRWGPCSVTCGVGHMMRSVKCWDSVAQVEIDDQYCTEEKPTNISTCKHPSCPDWSIGRWEDVSTQNVSNFVYRKLLIFLRLIDVFFSLILIPNPCLKRSVNLIARNLAK